MSIRYTFADVNTDAKPLIVAITRQLGARVYTHRCTGRASTGWGTTPLDAYNAWHRNWRRRFKFYGDREKWAQASIQRQQLSEQIRSEERARKHYWVNRSQLAHAADDFDVVPE